MVAESLGGNNLASFPGFPLVFISPAVEKSRESLGDLLTCPTYYLGQ